MESCRAWDFVDFIQRTAQVYKIVRQAAGPSGSCKLLTGVSVAWSFSKVSVTNEREGWVLSSGGNGKGVSAGEKMGGVGGV